MKNAVSSARTRTPQRLSLKCTITDGQLNIPMQQLARFTQTGEGGNATRGRSTSTTRGGSKTRTAGAGV